MLSVGWHLYTFKAWNGITRVAIQYLNLASSGDWSLDSFKDPSKHLLTASGILAKEQAAFLLARPVSILY
jgi:hypothetical protein